MADENSESGQLHSEEAETCISILQPFLHGWPRWRRIKTLHADLFVTSVSVRMNDRMILKLLLRAPGFQVPHSWLPRKKTKKQTQNSFNKCKAEFSTSLNFFYQNKGRLKRMLRTGSRSVVVSALDYWLESLGFKSHQSQDFQSATA